MAISSSLVNQKKINKENIINFSRLKNQKIFSRVRNLGFSLLDSGVSYEIIKSSLNILNISKGVIKLKDPVILILLDLIGENKSVLYISENSLRDEVIAKAVLALSGVNEDMVKKGALINEAKKDFEKACAFIYNSKLTFSSAKNLEDIRRDLDLIIIDDFEKEGNCFQEILGYFSEFSQKVNIPILLVSRNAENL